LLLACARRGTSKDELIDLIWGEDLPKSARGSWRRCGQPPLIHRLVQLNRPELLDGRGHGALDLNERVAYVAVLRLLQRNREVLAELHEHLERQGVPRRHHKLSDEQIADAAELYEQGWSHIRLGQHYNVDDETGPRAFKRAGVILRPRKGCPG
jgi:hypothetical protein